MSLLQRLHCAAIVFAVSFSAPPVAADEPFSAANQLLFLSDHLAALSAPAELRYDLVVNQPADQAFEDSIELRITASSTGEGKDVRVEYLTGERKRYVPPLTAAHGNPVVMVFLQRDVNEMARATGSPARAFQNMIKRALEEGAQVAPTRFTYENRQVQGTSISIEPYAGRPLPPGLETIARKRYEFLVSEAVPGWVYMMRTQDGASRSVIAQLTYRASGKPAGD